MPLVDAVLNDAADGAVATITHAQIHTADPEPASGVGTEATSARLPITWDAATGTIASADATLSFTGGAASGPATHIGLWSALAGGTFLGSHPLTGDQTFNAAGEYDVTNLSVDLNNA